MATKITLTVNGRTNTQLRPRNMHMHLLRALIKERHVYKMMNVMDFSGKQVHEETRVPLTAAQGDALVDEWFRRLPKEC